jgi:hypothetical protein
LIALATAYLEFGKNLFALGSLFQPFIGLDSTFSHLNEVKENHGGSSNLKIACKNSYLFDGLMGVHARGVFTNIDLRTDLAWRYHFTSTRNRLRVRFRSFGSSFTTEGVAVQRSSFEGLVQGGMWFRDCVQVYCQFSGEKGDRFSTYQVNFGIESIF